MIDSPRVTWPSPDSTPLPFRRTDKTVVDRISRFPVMSTIFDYSSRTKRIARANLGRKSALRIIFPTLPSPRVTSVELLRVTLRASPRPLTLRHATICCRTVSGYFVPGDLESRCGTAGTRLGRLLVSTASLGNGAKWGLLYADRGLRSSRRRRSYPHGRPTAAGAEARAARPGQPGMAGDGTSVSVRGQPYSLQAA